MGKVVIEDLPNGAANAFFRGGGVWKREIEEGEYGSVPRWHCVSSDNEALNSPKFHHLLEDFYKSSRYERKIRRFPRLGVTEEFADLQAIPTISQIEADDVNWLVEGMILQGSINLLTAPPGGFKTWLSLSLGGAVSTGTDFLSFKTVKTMVLYLDRENPPSVISERRDILKLHGGHFHVWGHWWKHAPPDIDDPRLIEIVRRHRPLIILDSLVRFHSADENSAKQMAKVFRRLRVLADAGATILILHHVPKTKNSQYRGSTDILAGVDAAFELCKEKSKNDTVLSLKCFKHRLIPETTIKIRLNWQEGCFEAVDDDSANAIPPAVIETIKTVITKHPRITQTRLIRKAKLPETNGRKILLQGNGIHWVAKRGTGTTLHYDLKK
jgi:archaellum biogenesis ATPase FlaH